MRELGGFRQDSERLVFDRQEVNTCGRRVGAEVGAGFQRPVDVAFEITRSGAGSVSGTQSGKTVIDGDRKAGAAGAPGRKGYTERQAEGFACSDTSRFGQRRFDAGEFVALRVLGPVMGVEPDGYGQGVEGMSRRAVIVTMPDRI